DFFKWAFTSVVSGNWHPLTLLSHAVDYALFGLSPWGHHLTSVILHSINTGLVFVVSISLFSLALPGEGREGGEGGRGDSDDASKRARLLLGACFTALLFGLHPLRVESVAWVSERKDLLCALFYLLSILAYIRYAAQGGGRGGYALALVFFVLSLMSKPMAVSLPVVLIIMDFYPLRRFGAGEKIKWVFIEKIPFFVFGVLGSLAALYAQRSSGAIATVEASPFLVRILVAARAYIFYLYKLIIPVKLAPVYPYPTDVRLFSLEYAGSIVLFLAVTLIVVLSVKRLKVLAALWAYYVITLIPVIGIVRVGAQGAADRYTYLPILGPCMLVGAFLIYSRVLRKLPYALIIAGIIILSGAFAIKTRAQISIWKDSITFWSYEIELYPEEGLMAYINRGDAYERLGLYNKQVEEMDRVIEIDPLYMPAYNNRGSAYGWLGEYELAAGDYKRAIELNPENALLYRNLAWALSKLGKMDESLVYYKRAAALGNIEAKNYLTERGLR
ncbi:MAG: tetratricopeptide repeat protein, partial [Thermodesulfobacteriota bacterium]